MDIGSWVGRWEWRSCGQGQVVVGEAKLAPLYAVNVFLTTEIKWKFIFVIETEWSVFMCLFLLMLTGISWEGKDCDIVWCIDRGLSCCTIAAYSVSIVDPLKHPLILLYSISYCIHCYPHSLVCIQKPVVLHYSNSLNSYCFSLKTSLSYSVPYPSRILCVPQSLDYPS